MLESLARVGVVTIDPEYASRTVVMHCLVQATIRQVIPPAMLEADVGRGKCACCRRGRVVIVTRWSTQALRDCTASLHRTAAGNCSGPRRRTRCCCGRARAWTGPG